MSESSAAEDAHRLIGSWKLSYYEHRRADGVVELPFGRSPVGRLVYLADGRMILLITDPARTPYRHPHLEADDAEVAAAARGCTAYSGSWRVEGDKVIHTIDQSLFPAPLTRIFERVGNQLTLKTAPFWVHGAEFTAMQIWDKDSG